MENIKWKVETRKVSDLKPWKHNPRIITELGLDQLKKSIDEIGYAQFININHDNEILSGHARWLVLKDKDQEREIPVLIPYRKLTIEEQEAVIVRMNKNIAGEWDFEILANKFEIDRLKEFGFKEEELGFIDIKPIKSGDNQNIEKNYNDNQVECPECGFLYEK